MDRHGTQPGYPTPEEAALSDFDPRYAKVVVVREAASPDDLEVELATNEPPRLYPYFVRVHREDGLWRVQSDGNGSSLI
jgi:hypothetical protein